jgi:hypothetical protein
MLQVICQLLVVVFFLFSLLQAIVLVQQTKWRITCSAKQTISKILEEKKEKAGMKLTHQRALDWKERVN